MVFAFRGFFYVSLLIIVLGIYIFHHRPGKTVQKEETTIQNWVKDQCLQSVIILLLNFQIYLTKFHIGALIFIFVLFTPLTLIKD